MQVKNQKWPEECFWRERTGVLEQWPTGSHVDLQDAWEFQGRQPRQRNLAVKMAEARHQGVTLVQPRGGLALVDKHLALLRYLQDQGGADILPATIDSYTRQGRYKEMEEGLAREFPGDQGMAHGFPAVNHGVEGCRRVTEAVRVPVQIRHGAPDARLLAEVSLAGGFTGIEGGGISANIPYLKNMPLEQTILAWQYVDRLIGFYEEQGVPINREPFGALTGALVPPCISHSIGIIEALLAAEQGVKSITLGYGQGGNLVQDVAAIHSLKTLAEEYLHRFGYREVVVTTVFHQWMGGFPQDASRAYGVIAWGATAAGLAGAHKVVTKSPHEALGWPGMESVASGLNATRQVLSMVRDQGMPDGQTLQQEIEMITAETRSILERVLELGEGDAAVGAVRGFQEGALDVPFAPSRLNPGKVLPVRDNRGAIRLLDTGNLPLGADAKEYNRERVAERGRVEKREPSFQMVIDDIYAIGKGMLLGRPK